MIKDLETKLPDILSHFGISGSLGNIIDGPIITSVEFKLAEGSKFSSIENIVKDIARELGVSGIRVTEIPNSTYICFEVPQQEAQTVNFPSIIHSPEFRSANYALPICIGVDMRGNPLIKDLSKMPHLLVAGTTGSGKSVGLNSFILSLINKKSPDELQFVLIDPKRIEFSMYNNQKYMYSPVITDMSEASECLAILVAEMNNRYTLFEKNMVRNIGEYQEKGLRMPYIVCIVDEFSDLILSDKTVEKQVLMLAQKARAAGIHLIIATQRPSVDVITGTIKANLPTRLSYKVASPVDSLTILNSHGAEALLGRGDSLLLEENGTLTRVLGTYVSNQDIMNTLESYRCTTTNKLNNAILSQQTEQPKTFKEKILSWWERLGKPMQRRIVNIGIAFVMALITGKSGKSKKSALETATDTAIKSAKRSVKAQAKRAITQTILDTLSKKK